ncbi:MAG TPA: hypothetical protein EYG90_02785, partial [Campylobacterales bacterium]|nr:hypothetical protein [Campylobacterales bacterium]
MTIYGIKTCDSVRKAIKFFKAKDMAFEFVDYKDILDKIAYLKRERLPPNLKVPTNPRLFPLAV